MLLDPRNILLKIDLVLIFLLSSTENDKMIKKLHKTSFKNVKKYA